jgi:hypothetical protein
MEMFEKILRFKEVQEGPDSPVYPLIPRFDPEKICNFEM